MESKKNEVFQSLPCNNFNLPGRGVANARNTVNVKYYMLILFTTQPLAITTDLVINNNLVTVLASNVVALFTAYFYHKYKK